MELLLLQLCVFKFNLQLLVLGLLWLQQIWMMQLLRLLRLLLLLRHLKVELIHELSLLRMHQLLRCV